MSAGDKAEFGDVPVYQPKTYKGIVIEDTLVSTVSNILQFPLFSFENSCRFSVRTLRSATTKKMMVSELSHSRSGKSMKQHQ